ncbi:MAG: flagellar hook-associated protein FlgL [Thermoleophilia bacterium]
MIDRIGSQQMSRNFLADLNRNQYDIAGLQRQLATGKRLNNPSDDPIGVGIALGIRDDLASVEAWQRNIADSQSWLSATDNALNGYQDIIQRAQELAVQGGNGTLSAGGRLQLATEVLALRDQVVETGNASLGGRYLFGGTQTNRQPMDGSIPGLAAPVNTGVLTREVAQGQVLSVNITADRLVDPAGATPDIFQTLTDFATALQTGDLQAISGTTMTELDAHLDNVNRLRGEIGAKVNRLDLTEQRHSLDNITRQQQQSEIEDTDIAEAITNLKMRETVLQASMAVGARTMQRSLVDFIS